MNQWSSHYGRKAFDVLTADGSRVVYDGTEFFGMTYQSSGGCTSEGWQADSTLLFKCSADPSAINRLDPDTGAIDIICQGGEPVFSSDFKGWSPDGQRLLIISGSVYSPNAYYIVDKDGSHLTFLTELAGESYSQDWSPDGRYIVYTEGTRSDTKLKLIDTDGQNPRELTTGDRPRWSPDGRTIAFLREYSLYRIDPDGANLAPLGLSGVHAFAWSPDGSRIAIVKHSTTDDLPDTLSVVAVDRPADQPVVLSSRFIVSLAPAWSPDGRQLAFAAQTEPNGDFAVYVIDADGSHLRKLVENTSHRTPSWGADGRSLVLNGISVVDLDDGTVRALEYDLLSYALNELSSDGQTIALNVLHWGKTAYNDDTTDVYLGNIDGRPPVDLTGPLNNQFRHPCNPKP